LCALRTAGFNRLGGFYFDWEFKVVANELIWMSEASKAIAKVATVTGAKDFIDKAAVYKLIAAKQQWTIAQRAELSEIEINATVRLGELLKATALPGGQRSPGKSGASASLPPEITHKLSSVAQKLASVPIRQRAKYIADNKASGKLSVTGLSRMAKENQREKKRQIDRATVAQAPAPSRLSGVFSTIVIDPPWDFGDEGDVDQFGRGKPDYATMSIAEIAALPVGERAAKDAHIYMWITNRSLPKGFALLDAWGFRYVTCLTWCKPSIGLGNYFRGSTEQILFGVRGSLPLKRKDVGTWIAMPRPNRKHSAKPAEFFDLVESCSHGPYLEMFSRTDRDGWTAWGSGS